jgi:hypothetical protein
LSPASTSFPFPALCAASSSSQATGHRRPLCLRRHPLLPLPRPALPEEQPHQRVSTFRPDERNFLDFDSNNSNHAVKKGCQDTLVNSQEQEDPPAPPLRLQPLPPLPLSPRIHPLPLPLLPPLPPLAGTSQTLLPSTEEEGSQPSYLPPLPLPSRHSRAPFRLQLAQSSNNWARRVQQKLLRRRRKARRSRGGTGSRIITRRRAM